ncbi:MAG: MarR family transcriptional regulator [Mucilaginibacter sp.]|uniref:MarR family winged helix-turn-helix transcriptional regulator n=1 Tax=Mucilaginibacter sp. TaxID=1882438 RepID=UPI00319F1A27
MYTCKRTHEIRAFNRFYTDLLGLLDTHLLESEYSLAEARILYEIFTGREISASDIIQKLKVDKGYLSRILKKLEKQELITKKLSKGDARVTLISLTGDGVEVFHQLNNASDKQIGALITEMNITQLDDLINHMNAIMTLLQKSRD